MRITKMVSAAKRAANKKNSENSTGPKSPRGKSFSCQNSLRHGILSSDWLLPGESEKELNQLRSDMIISYFPDGSAELHRVEMIVWDEWRLKRFYRAETGAIAKRLAERNPAAEITASVHTPQHHQAARDLAKLKEIEAQIGSEGLPSKENLAWLRELNYGEPVKHFLEAVELTQLAGPGEGVPPSPDGAAAAESGRPTSAENAATSKEKQDLFRAFLLSALEPLTVAIQEQLVFHGRFVMQREVAQCNALQLPQEAELDRYLRYEKHLLKNLHRNQNALERMQRRRLGDEVPPPSAKFD